MINRCPKCQTLFANGVICPKCGGNIIDMKEETELETAVGKAENVSHSTINNSQNNTQSYNNPQHYIPPATAYNAPPKQYHRHPFYALGIFSIILGVFLILIGLFLEIPPKEIDTWKISSKHGDEQYTEYVGGDAYNIIIEASLRGGIISGRTAAKAIYEVGGIIVLIAGIAFIVASNKYRNNFMPVQNYPMPPVQQNNSFTQNYSKTHN